MIQGIHPALWRVSALAAAVWAAPVGASTTAAPPDSYTVAVEAIPPESDLFDAPVYYERNLDRYSRPDDLASLRSGKVRVQHFEAIDVSDFTWRRAGSEYTWWMQMQELRFLLPLIASERRADRELAKAWLSRWFDVHVVGGVPATNQGEPMTFAYRAMVFVFYLKSELRRPHPDPDVVAMLQTSILTHQTHLLPDQNFDADNNHGMIEAIGLIETTRVFPNHAARLLALHRIRDLVAKSVSPEGIHMEHSAVYHFIFLRWVDEIAAYARELAGVPPAFNSEIASASRRMRDRAYFLQDHRGWIPPIGDTDSIAVDYYSSDYRFHHARNSATTVFDTESGYAVFKGRDRRTDPRYVVFRQPSKRIAMPAHAHSDALSVLVDWDGEVVLGDAGRYSYTPGPKRQFFKSQMAHSTVLPPSSSPSGAMSSLPIVVEPADVSSPRATSWTADMDFRIGRVTRVVRIPRGGRDVVVNDAVFVNESTPPDVPTTTILWQIGRDVERVDAERMGEDGVWSWRLTTRRGERALLEIRVSGGASSILAEVDVVSGQESPLLGWYSPGQSVLRPVPTIRVAITGTEAYVQMRLRFWRR